MRVGSLLAWAAACVLLLCAAAAPARAAAALRASALSGTELLQALEDGATEISLLGNIQLSPADWQQFTLPIVLPENATVLIHYDSPGTTWGNRAFLDWGSALNLIDVPPGTTLRFDSIISADPGNYTLGLETMAFKQNGSYLWPTVNAQTGASLEFQNCFLFNDDNRCSPETTEAAITRLQAILGEGSIEYVGGVKAFYPNLSSPIPNFDMEEGQIVGSVYLSYVNTSSACFNSLEPRSGASSSGSSGPTQAVSVSNGIEFLTALEDGATNISLTADIQLGPQDWQKFALPIQIAENTSVLIFFIDASSGWGLRPRLLSWGYAMNLINVPASATLAFENIVSKDPGNYTLGLETMALKTNGSFVWPTVNTETDSALTFDNCFLFHDDNRCSPETTEAAITRLQAILGEGSIEYLGGVKAFYPNLTSPLPVFDMAADRIVGSMSYVLRNVTSECFNSLDPAAMPHTSDDSLYTGTGASSSSGSSSGGGGTPSWVWAVVGTVAGLAALAAGAAAFFWRRRRQQQGQALGLKPEDCMESGSAKGSDDRKGLVVSRGGSLQPDQSGSVHGGAGSGGLNGQAHGSAELHTTFMRTRFGVIDDLQLGEVLGRGAYGRVYKGRWKGVIVAVKVIEHRVQPGQVVDPSREPLLCMSVSHPNAVTCHQMSILRVSGGGRGEQAGLHPAGSGGLDASGGGGSGMPRRPSIGGRLVASPGGSNMVEVVSPHDVLLPGLYENWIVMEYCDKGSLSDHLSAGRLPPIATALRQREVHVVLCLLDIALGLNYLHSAGIVHGDLKPANVLLKAARNDRRGFVCKLGDFGLSRMLGQGQSHVDTTSYGTPSYAAPELLKEGRLTKAADIYSLGIMVWEMVAGEPHGGDLTTMQIILQVSQNKYRPQVPAHCSPVLGELMQSCWSEDPADRPTASALVDKLRGLVTPLLRASATVPVLAASAAQAPADPSVTS